jgi:hypothetical protein
MSTGVVGMDTIAFDEATEAVIAKSKTVDESGSEMSATYVITLSSPHSFVFQAKIRTFGPVQDDGPKYTFKRCKCEKEDQENDDD